MNIAVTDFETQAWPEEQVSLMADFFVVTQPMEDSSRRLFKERVEVELSHAKLGVSLDILETRQTRQKHGVDMLNFLKDLADKHQVSIFLDAEPLEGSPVSQPRLKQWYEDNGFKRNGGSGMRYFPQGQ